MTYQKGGGKLPGKTEFSGRRRSMTRRSGFKSHADSTGGEFKVESVPSMVLDAGASLALEFELPDGDDDDLLCFGGWFCSDKPLTIAVENGPRRLTATEYAWPNWNKVGSMWRRSEHSVQRVTITLTASATTRIALFDMQAGVVTHRHLDGARAALMKNMYQFSPEAHFCDTPTDVRYQATDDALLHDDGTPVELMLKSCNRCARFLPVNTDNERMSLSFSNHCVAAHRRPCRHGGFGILKDVESGERLELEYGFQLECRYCKKFEVNAAHNPQRTTAQMKEDAARRRGIELLIAAIYEGSPQLRFRHVSGEELSDYVFRQFGGKCFKCGAVLPERGWHLDHTRPLALLWPLDETATALCGNCNSAKRDRAPVDFYNEQQLQEIAEITQIPPNELETPTPNMELVEELLGRLDWFFDEFLTTPEMLREHDGKIAGELLVKALQKVLEQCPGGCPVDLVSEFNARRS